MKTTSTILPDFISDFNLEYTEVGVCYDALVNFNLQFQSFNLQTEIQMVPILSYDIDTVYLLNPIIETYKMPTLFNEVNHQFIYAKHNGLIIMGELPLFGVFTISIIPKKFSCSAETFNELRSKRLN